MKQICVDIYLIDFQSFPECSLEALSERLNRMQKAFRFIYRRGNTKPQLDIEDKWYVKKTVINLVTNSVLLSRSDCILIGVFDDKFVESKADLDEYGRDKPEYFGYTDYRRVGALSVHPKVSKYRRAGSSIEQYLVFLLVWCISEILNNSGEFQHGERAFCVNNSSETYDDFAYSMQHPAICDSCKNHLLNSKSITIRQLREIDHLLKWTSESKISKKASEVADSTFFSLLSGTVLGYAISIFVAKDQWQIVLLLWVVLVAAFGILIWNRK